MGVGLVMGGVRIVVIWVVAPVHHRSIHALRVTLVVAGHGRVVCVLGPLMSVLVMLGPPISGVRVSCLTAVARGVLRVVWRMLGLLKGSIITHSNYYKQFLTLEIKHQ
jgi:hypothetical protein